MPDHTNSDEDSSPADGLEVSVAVLVRSLFQGSSVVLPVTAPKFATHGSETAALDELRRFLQEYVDRLPGRSVAGLCLPGELSLEEIEVSLVPLDVPRKLRIPIPITFPCVVVPVERDRWVLLPTINHALFVSANESVSDVVQQEVGRLVAASGISSYERLALLPARAHALHTISVRLADAPSAGGAKDARRALSAFVQRKRAVEALAEVATPLHLQRDTTHPPPIVGRERELRTLRALLDEPTRTGVLVVGPAGSGKTALIRAWTHATDRLVYRTSGARLVAGMGGLGQWEERVQAVAAALEVLDAVLVLEDLEDVLAERVETGGVDIAGGLRSPLDSGKLRLLAEVREDRVDVLEQRNWALFSTLTRVAVPSLTSAATEQVLRERDAHERQLDSSIHAFDDSALHAIVELTNRYVPYTSFPGKAIRLYRELRGTHDAGSPDPEAKRRIVRGDVTALFSRVTGIPAALLSDETPLRVESVAASLRAEVIGQEQAVRALAETIAVVKAGLQPEDKPLATFLFVGPTGVGKTELARALARVLFGSMDRLVRFDMSEFMTPGAAERLIRGTDSEDGMLTRRVREQPFSVVLLDEIEKADGAVFDLLLQVAGEGRLTDARGRTTFFRNTILIMTSNLGAMNRRGAVGFAGVKATDAAHYAKLVQASFRPEFVNRIDRIVPFTRLTEDQMNDVARLLVDRIGKRPGFRDHGISFAVTDRAVRRLAKDGYEPAYGARGLRRHAEQALVAPIARCLARLGKAPLDAVVHVRLGEEQAPASPGVVCAQVTSGPFVLSVVRPKRGGAARAGRGFRGIASLRREADRIVRLAAVEEVRDQIGYLVAQLGTAQRASSDPRSQKDISLMQGEHKRLEEIWRPVCQAHEELRAIEELAFAAVLEGHPIDTLSADAAAADRRFRAGLPHVLLALEPRRNEATFIFEELDDGAFDPWLIDLLEAVSKRRWDVALHIHGDMHADASVAPPGGSWGVPRSPAHVLDLLRRGQGFRNVVVRCRGPFAGVLLGLEAGLHTMIEPPWRAGNAPPRERARVYAHFITLDYDLREAQWKHASLAPPRPSSAGRRRKGTPARELDWSEQRIRVAGKTAVLDMDPDRYWSELERVALAMLLVAEADDTAISRDQLYLPAISPDEV